MQITREKEQHLTNSGIRGAEAAEFRKANDGGGSRNQLTGTAISLLASTER